MSIGESASSMSVRRATHCLAGSRKSNVHLRSAGAVQAHTVDRTAYSQKVKQGSGTERVLRYPDGRVRYIRYPLTTTENEAHSDQVDVTVSYEEDWDPDRWDDIDWPWDTSCLWEGASSSNAAVVTPLTSQPAQKSIFQQKVTRITPQSLLFAIGPLSLPHSTCDCRRDIRSTVQQTCCVHSMQQGICKRNKTSCKRSRTVMR